jgi:hypothetical protein
MAIDNLSPAEGNFSQRLAIPPPPRGFAAADCQFRRRRGEFRTVIGNSSPAERTLGWRSSIPAPARGMSHSDWQCQHGREDSRPFDSCLENFLDSGSHLLPWKEWFTADQQRSFLKLIKSLTRS